MHEINRPLYTDIILQSFMISAAHEDQGTRAQRTLSMWPPPIDECSRIPKGYKRVRSQAPGYSDEYCVNQYPHKKVDINELLISAN